MTVLYRNEKTIKEKWKKNPRKLKKENTYMKKCRKECKEKEMAVECMICEKEIVILENQESLCDTCMKKIRQYYSNNAVRNLREEKWNMALKQAEGNFQKACDIFDDMY